MLHSKTLNARSAPSGRQVSSCSFVHPTRTGPVSWRSAADRAALGHQQPLLSMQHRRSTACRTATTTSEARSITQGRFMQSKTEALWFYGFLSMVYDHIVNPGHWTEDMREDALEPAQLDNPNLKVVDVGGGTGFCTLGVVKTIKPENVTLIDQSPAQLAKARAKPALKDVTILTGDAEDLPFPTDSFDRYVSAGSIEYWPDPQRGIKEAYRVIKEGGVACMIGPVYPTFWLSRIMADMFMLFPTEEEYMEWFTKAGFTDIKLKRIGPSWYRGVRRHGLIMGCSVTATKPKAGESPLQMGPIVAAPRPNPLAIFVRMLLGYVGGMYYFLVPVYMYLKNLVWPRNAAGF